MTVENTIEDRAPAQTAAQPARQGAARQIDAFLESIEPFFYGKAISYVDIGAHKGDVFAEIVAAGPKLRRAHLIEPNPASFAALTETVARLDTAEGTAAEITCLNRAVSDRPGTLTLRAADSMTRVVGEGDAGARGGPAGNGDGALPPGLFQVEAVTLDALVAGFEKPQITLLKVDVEGHEAAVIAGAAGLLAEQAIDMIYIEAGMNPEGGQQTYYRVIEDLLASHGYRLFRIFEQKHEWQEDSPFLRRVNLAFMSPRFAAAHPYRLSAALLEARKENTALTGALKTARTKRQEAASQAAALRDEMAALRTAAARHAKEAAASAEALKTAQAELHAATARHAREAAASAEALKAAQAELHAASARHAREAAVLKAVQAELRTATARHAGEVAASAEAFEAAERDRSQLRSYARTLEARHRAVLESTTWRVMEPVRRVLRTLRGSKAPQPFVPRLADSAATAGKKKSLTPAETRSIRLSETHRLVHHLWGGLSRPAESSLARVVEDPTADPECRFIAAHELATWHAFNGDAEAALNKIQAIERIAPAYRDHKKRWMKEGFIQLARGEREAATSCFRHLLATRAGSNDPDALLALASGADSDAARLASLNEVFSRAGFARIEQVDPAQPLALDNIRGRLGDLGSGSQSQAAGDLGRVSVIMPAYAAAARIGTALCSLCEQSYTDLEILVVDDASPDDTAAVVEQWAARDPRIRLIRQAENGGAYAARNRGLAEASGEYVITHDSDDWSHPQKIAAQMAYLAEHPEVAGVCSYWVRTHADLKISPNWRIGGQPLHWSQSSFLVRRAVLEALGPWDPVRVGADTELIWRVEAAHGKEAVAKILPEVPLAFAFDDESGSLTRAKATHVRTVYFGLRQIYRAIARHSHAAKTDPAAAARRRRAMIPPELTGRTGPYPLDFLLIGDCCDRGIVGQMQAFADSSDGMGMRIGLFHWPDFAARRRGFCAAYCQLLERENVRAVLPTAEVVLPRRFGIFFGRDHAEIDQFPTVLAAPAVSRPAG
jgi:FkbM family methyltransferase